MTSAKKQFTVAAVVCVVLAAALAVHKVRSWTEGQQSLNRNWLLAAQCVSRHDYAGAIRYQKQAVSADPHDRGTQLQLAYYLLHEHRTSEANPILLSLAKNNDNAGQKAKALLAHTRNGYIVH